MKIGVLGGTFDPIHLGHLAIAEEARKRLGLTEVLFVPAGEPWQKAEQKIAAAVHRVEMVRLAIADRPYFKLSMVEIDRPGTSYTVDTIAELRGKSRDEDELFFILGSDAAARFHQWREPARIAEMCHLVIVPRPGYTLPSLESLEALVPGLSRKVALLDKPLVEIDATEIRKRVVRRLSIHHLVPEVVEAYIEAHKLYATE